MTMLIHQFHYGSPRRKNEMLAKVVILAIVLAAATCQEQRYVYKAPHQAPKEYKHSYEHIPLKAYPTAPAEPAPISEEQYQDRAPQEREPQENYGHAFSSQSIIHHPGQQGSQENSEEQVVPVYQYVSEPNEESNAYNQMPQKYQAVHYPVPAPVHLDIPTVKFPSNPKPKPHYVQAEESLPYHHAHAQPTPVARPEIHSYESHDEPIDYYAYPKYQYEYKVEDPHTGDNKFQHEIRDGDVVKGVYGLHEADGSIRTVEYSSDKHSGFSAIVKHTAPGQHVQIETHHQN
ncbi:hypothetical protein K1T71_004377 [Dendrolimus kikuchii]|uniref:Uncharacterized protein n=1 Tax=Dendrolimus kikuchii TaxID=765133 RepID=A0ACC1D7B8_9NEOP|nr:hypothetical protein K1T71_004377 [Dendrolimus kikuchii]